MVLFRITENEPSKMNNVRPYVYSRPWFQLNRMISDFLYEFACARYDAMHLKIH